jgi:lysophospholipase L1-like esterase
VEQACPASPSVLAENGAPARRLVTTSAVVVHILAIGSSSTEGIGATNPRFTYPAQLRTNLSSSWGIGAEVRNAGIGGERAVETVDRLAAAVRMNWADLVLWQVGTNDALTGEDDALFRAVVQRGIDAVRGTRAELILIDPQVTLKMKDPARYESYVRMVGAIGRDDHVRVFSRYTLMKAWQHDSPDILTSMLSADGLHMSDRGYGCFAARLAEEMVREWGRSLQLLSSNKATQPVVPVPPHADLHAPSAVKPNGAT